MNKRIAVGFIAVAAILGFCCRGDELLAQATAPTPGPGVLNVPDSALGGPLPESVKRTIREYTRYWVAQLKSANQVKDTISARKKLVDAYNRYASPFWKYAYAQIAAQEVPAALKWNDQVKQIHASMALASMSQVTIQPALEEMARHSNPVVRYWAVRGYRSTAKRIMDQGGAYAKTMLGTLERLGTKESTPAIVGAILRALCPYPGARPGEVAKLRDVQIRVWLARRKEVMAGVPEMLNAYLGTLRFLSPTNQADEKVVLQMLADLLEASTVAFDRPKNIKGKVGAAFRELLITLEARLNVIIRLGKTPIQKILADGKLTRAISTKVRLAFNETWKPALAKRGVKPRAVAKPATAPAPAAATSPSGG